MQSTNIADLGTWNVTLQAKLLNYAGVVAVSSTFTLNVGPGYATQDTS